MRLDRQGRRDLDEALENVGTPDDAEIFDDLAGPARYRLAPTPLTIVACLGCRHLGLIPTIPRVPRLTWTCPGCQRAWALEPPPRIWVAGSAPALVPGRPS